MSPAIRYFTVASLLYLAAGAIIGFIMAAFPGSLPYLLLAHVHFLLLGFMAMMIYSVGYHVLPRFSGFNLYSEKLVALQFYLVNAGLLGMASTWIYCRDSIEGFFPWMSISVFAGAELAGILIFVFNNIMTLSGKGGKALS